MLHDYTSPDHYRTIIETSKTMPVFVFKHSTSCPISAAAFGEFTAFSESHPQFPCWTVLVRENRDLALALAKQSGIIHQSPQVILFYLEKPVWNCSHRQITEPSLSQALDASFT